MLLVLVKGDSCLEPIQGGVIARKPRGPCYKVVLCPRPFPPTFSSTPRPCGINHLLFSYLFNLFLSTVSFHVADTIALVVQILKQTTKPAHEPVSLKVTVPFSSCHHSTPACSTSSPSVYSSTLCSPDPVPPWTAHS